VASLRNFFVHVCVRVYVSFFLIMDYGCRENIAGAERVASQLGKISQESALKSYHMINSKES